MSHMSQSYRSSELKSMELIEKEIHEILKKQTHPSVIPSLLLMRISVVGAYIRTFHRHGGPLRHLRLMH